MSNESRNKEYSHINKIVLRLRPSSLATILFLSLAAIVLAYVAGVMSGRHREDKKEIVEAPIVNESGEIEKILTPDQLEYARALRGEAKPVNNPEPAADAVQGIENPASTTADVIPKPDQANAQDPELIYDYVFQVGAFRDEAGADNLRQRLEGYGYRTTLEKNGKMFIVLVRLRGKKSSVDELETIINQLRLGAPLQRSRKPVTP